MSAWERSYNDPRPGEWHIVTIEKPSGFAKDSYTGRGTAGDPWIIKYKRRAGAVNSMDSYALSTCAADAPDRNAYLELLVEGLTPSKDRPTVRDGAGGGPTGPARPAASKAVKTPAKAKARK